MSANPRGAPGQPPVDVELRTLRARVEALEAQIASLPVRTAAPSHPIVDAGFGVVTKWEKNVVSVRMMPFGNPADWKTADYGPEADTSNEITNCFAPFQLFAKNVTPVIWLRMANMDRPIVIPIHPDVDKWDPKPSMSWTEPAEADLEESADLPIADAPAGGWDDIPELEGL